MNQYIKQYQKMNIETASREQILIMLYDGAILFLNKAKIAIQNKQIEEAHKNIMGCEKIIEEFINSLDHSVAPQLTQNLQSLYEYYLRQLVKANLKKDIMIIDEVLNFLKSMRMTWAKAIEIANKQQVSKNKQDEDNEEDDE